MLSLAALATGILSAPLAQASNLSDATIYAIFDQANMADIASGRLAWAKSRNPEVRRLAKMVITDHTAVQQMGRDIAKQMNALGTPPAGDASWSQMAQTLERLDKLEGAEFDAAYLRHEIGFHAAVINAIDTVLLPAIEDARFKGLVRKVLPGFQHHLNETRAVAEKLGVTQIH
ncbi:putative outer membrane-like protein [Magnetofaba australis IT-1]|uniref:Putative outer membrane-like protein n=1 Tax=Magnetofaba australis IT-1 TaxID=1434232 RepID=A0A1Y2K1R6_9PROT|nr:putative outer membrane-like protein [Magnetofaba australis IT-1]